MREGPQPQCLVAERSALPSRFHSFTLLFLTSFTLSLLKIVPERTPAPQPSTNPKPYLYLFLSGFFRIKSRKGNYQAKQSHHLRQLPGLWIPCILSFSLLPLCSLCAYLCDLCVTVPLCPTLLFLCVPQRPLRLCVIFTLYSFFLSLSLSPKLKTVNCKLKTVNSSPSRPPLLIRQKRTHQTNHK